MNYELMLIQKMNNSTDPIISYYHQLFAQLNLSHLMIQYNDSVNSTLLKEILEENFIWPSDMRLSLQLIEKISEPDTVEGSLRPM